MPFVVLDALQSSHLILITVLQMRDSYWHEESGFREDDRLTQARKPCKGVSGEPEFEPRVI